MLQTIQTLHESSCVFPMKKLPICGAKRGRPHVSLEQLRRPHSPG